MRYYVNPRNESNESFLMREGIEVPSHWKINWNSVPKGFLPVVLIDNGTFIAAGVAYSEAEFKVFNQ